MQHTYVLIDFENVQVKSLALLKGEHFQVKVFLGPKNARLPVDLVLAMHDLGTRADYIMLGVSGANALDFHITYYLGKLTAEDPQGLFYIISKDTGFDSLLKHLQSKHIDCKRVAAIEQMPGLAAAPVLPAEIRKAVPLPKSKPAPPKPKAKAAAPAKKTVPPATPGKMVAEVPQTPIPKVEALVQVVMADLVKRAKSRPATVKTLLSTIKANKKIPATEAQAIFDLLVTRGVVTLKGSKVAYSLPG